MSLSIQSNLWIIPTVQSIHIVCIGIVLASVLMITLRILGWAGKDQTLAQTTCRFLPWLWSALAILLLTGALMVIGEPVRELLSLSFWVKMGLLFVGIDFAAVFYFHLRKYADTWENSFIHQWRVKVLALITLLIWCSIVVMGRLIAYDHVWGSWSLRPLV